MSEIKTQPPLNYYNGFAIAISPQLPRRHKKHDERKDRIKNNKSTLGEYLRKKSKHEFIVTHLRTVMQDLQLTVLRAVCGYPQVCGYHPLLLPASQYH